ncbi:inaD-like protein [Ctenocephalides felis]|uniref:inaD-like protein n=1 Tax=Ctenocephalides felis TaxID=7515 RepID=UPI000E6E2591|nr:inaD-like protein [Ctenocephalides felis]
MSSSSSLSYGPTIDMTVTADTQESAEIKNSNGNRPKNALSRSASMQGQWGPERIVCVPREFGQEGLGISIVGGKADLTDEEGKRDIVGIFVKNVSPKSPAEKTGGFQTGDRILEVDGVDLRNASHEKAVEVIRGAESPVKFVVQSLLNMTPSPSTDLLQPEGAKLIPQSPFRTGSATPTDFNEPKKPEKYRDRLQFQYL